MTMPNSTETFRHVMYLLFKPSAEDLKEAEQVLAKFREAGGDAATLAELEADLESAKANPKRQAEVELEF